MSISKRSAAASAGAHQRRQGRRPGAHHQHLESAGRGDRDRVSAAGRKLRLRPGFRRRRKLSRRAWAAARVARSAIATSRHRRAFPHRPWGLFGGGSGAPDVSCSRVPAASCGNCRPSRTGSSSMRTRRSCLNRRRGRLRAGLGAQPRGNRARPRERQVLRGLHCQELRSATGCGIAGWGVLVAIKPARAARGSRPRHVGWGDHPRAPARMLRWSAPFVLSHGNGFAIDAYYPFWRHFLPRLRGDRVRSAQSRLEPAP